MASPALAAQVEFEGGFSLLSEQFSGFLFGWSRPRAGPRADRSGGVGARSAARRQDPDQVIVYGREAVQLARATSSGYVARKLQRLRIDLGPLARDARVVELGAEIDALRTL
ncbi:hypothetical protein [Streptomyces prunicolor]|uniref:hypothetical protein n=1 Tax=Streptomyces prunicolor TaxID=67348 RepID=UPI0003793C77|nr:hypothetical protein [Streptomyces prunicolor]